MILFRRHLKSCPATAGTSRRWYKDCRCPVWADQRGEGGTVRSLKTSDWDKAVALSSSKSCSLARAAADWELSIFHANKAARTLEKYGSTLRKFVACSDRWGFTEVAEVTPEAIETFVNEPGAPATRAKRLTILRQFLKYCQRHGWCKDNPAELVEAPKIKPTRYPTPFSQEQLERIFADLERDQDRRFALLAKLLLASGMRVGDAVGIQASSLRDQGILLRTEKTGGEVLLPLEAGLFDAVRAVAASGGFPAGQSTPTFIRQVQRRFKRAFEVAGCPQASVHWFRHTRASLLRAKGATPAEVGDILGISARTAERSYTKWCPERKKRLEWLLR